MSRVRASETEYAVPPNVEEGSVVSAFRVPAEQAGQRVDVFVQTQLHRTSRTRAQYIVRMSAYDAAGRKLKPNDRVRTGEHVLLWRAPWDETPVPTDIPILYEDEHLMVVDKPAGLPVHPTARYHKNTLIMLLQAARPGEFLSLGHRLDRETSGVLIVSKTATCDRALKWDLSEREEIEKRYMAITWGRPDPGDLATEFRIDRSMELDATSRYKVKMCVSDSPTALTAATRFAILGESCSRSGRLYAKVQCDLETGRQHQIRVHLASLGTPIVGDKLYGPDESMFARSADGELTPEDDVLMELPRHALHAARIALAHPVTRRPLEADAPLPADMRTFWAGIPLR